MTLPETVLCVGGPYDGEKHPFPKVGATIRFRTYTEMGVAEYLRHGGTYNRDTHDADIGYHIHKLADGAFVAGLHTLDLGQVLRRLVHGYQAVVHK